MMAVSSTAIAGNTTGWRAKLRKASFRGVEFGVTDAEGEGGRRTVTHEFPQRDLPYVEDMGLATAKFTLQAFVLGADYMGVRRVVVRTAVVLARQGGALPRMSAVYLIPDLFSATVIVSYNKGYQFYSTVKFSVGRFRMYGSFVCPRFYKVCDIIIHHENNSENSQRLRVKWLLK